MHPVNSILQVTIFAKIPRLANPYGFRFIEVQTQHSKRYLEMPWSNLRGINGVSKKSREQSDCGSLQKSSYISAFRLGTYIATQFKPLVAKSIYEMTEVLTTKVLDTSCDPGVTFVWILCQ